MSEVPSSPEATRRPKRGRSPSYPGISLEEAERRAHELYTAERQHSAPVSAIVEHWGYSSTSSGGRTVLAALKKFGLLEDAGSGEERSARLTDLGVDLVLNPSPLAGRQEAALLPRFHRQMWDEYGADLPSVATLRYRLIKEFAFTESGAEEFLQEYQATIRYAQLTGRDDPIDQASADASRERPSAPGSYTDERSPGTARTQAVPSGPALPPATSSGLTIPIPMLDDSPVYLTGNFPLSEEGWEQLTRVLEAMKPGLVRPAVPRKENLPPTASPVHEVLGEADGGLRRSEYDPDDG